jgi:hypothetical protein
MKDFSGARIMDCLSGSNWRPRQMDREEDFAAQSTFLQTQTKMKQDLIPFARV